MCNKYQDDISMYVDDMLTQEDAKILEEHINFCESCKQDYENLITLKNAMQSIDDIDFPENLHESIMSKVNESKFSKTNEKQTGKIIKINFTKKVAYASSIVALLIVFAPTVLNVGYNITQTSVMADDLGLKDRLSYIKENGLFANSLSIVISTGDIEKTTTDLCAKLDSYPDKEIYENSKATSITLDMTRTDVHDLLSYILPTYENTVYSSSKYNLYKSIEKEIEERTNAQFSIDDLHINAESTFLNPKNINVNITIRS